MVHCLTWSSKAKEVLGGEIRGVIMRGENKAADEIKMLLEIKFEDFFFFSGFKARSKVGFILQ